LSRRLTSPSKNLQCPGKVERLEEEGDGLQIQNRLVLCCSQGENWNWVDGVILGRFLLE